MEVLRSSSFLSSHLSTLPTKIPTKPFHKPISHLPPNPSPNPSFPSVRRFPAKLKPFSAVSPTVSTEREDPPAGTQVEVQNQGEKFDWFSQWYPIMPVCDLDKRVPHGKKVMGLDVVVWWDRNENAWKVLDDRCPHRLAPLSEGRIDQWGRLQCVYHGWCFNGSGDCKFIPQAPPDGPPVHSFKKACVAAYPSIVQHEIVWFWPSTDPQYKDIVMKKKPPYIPELDDPSFTKLMGNRDIPYGYEVLTENLLDPAHVHYAHYGIMRVPSAKNRVKADREGGRPMELSVTTLDVNGFIGKPERGNFQFIAPCILYLFANSVAGQGTIGSLSSSETKKESPTRAAQKSVLLIFMCIPVSPGNSRLIWTFPRNFGHWVDRIVPRWMFHMPQNLILDSDLYILHVEEKKIMEAGPSNWQKACFVPTKSDAFVVGFRRWLSKYSGGMIDWGAKFGDGALPPTPPMKQLMDRYESHVANCSSCRAAEKGLRVLEAVLQVVSVASIGIVAAMKQSAVSAATRASLVSMAVLCFIASRWLAHFTYKIFHYHGYSHAFR